jgi:TolB protein
MLNRRSFTTASGLALAGPAAWAQFRVEISGVGATQMPIAIVPFRDEEKSTQALSTIVRADLERSGVFRGVDANVRMDETAQPNMGDWRSRGADALVAGSVTRLADGRFDVRVRLWDVVRGKEIELFSRVTAGTELRWTAHMVADFIYEKLTGEKGVFATRIAYVTRGGGRYVLRVADSDGENAQLATASADPIISPAWSPNGQELAYVSFEKQKATIFAQNIATGARREIANFRGSNSAPAWAPDGQSLAATLSREGGSQLFLIGRNGENPRRITSSSSIDTEPVFTPDGKSLYFVSDRSGGPQIYRIPVAGGSAERVSFTGGYNISPALSPDGRYLAYISRQNGAFRLYVADLRTPGATPVALTDTNDDENPSFAPNGRLIIYSTRQQGRDVLMTTTLDGKIKARLPSAIDVREPMWGPYGR